MPHPYLLMPRPANPKSATPASDKFVQFVTLALHGHPNTRMPISLTLPHIYPETKAPPTGKTPVLRFPVRLKCATCYTSVSEWTTASSFEAPASTT